MNQKKKLMRLGLVTTTLIILISLYAGYIDSSNIKESEDEDFTGPTLSFFSFEENCTGGAFNSSGVGVSEERWSNDTTLIISAIIHMNCARHIGSASILLDNKTLKLRYEEIGNEGVTAHCFCTYKLYYVIKNIEHEEYDIEIIPIERLI
ncbi:hypothetical protein MBGDN05_00692 [Thermoplasmatales archaeon SCGC AB-539-N05]|nr:hypothetical protein MBGDN05_00692 [Thermoplasmatales archaeon SCGC AB-539-N05]